MQMLPEFGIVFLHHRKDDVTLNNLATFREWNPGVPLVTMSGSEERIEGGYTIHDFPEEAVQWTRHTSGGELRGRSADLLVYAWHRHRRERARHWVLVEWDAYCGMPLSEFYSPVRDHDLVAPAVRWPLREPEWSWFHQKWTLPDWLAAKSVGVMPFCFLWVADAVLEEMVRLVPWDQLGRCNSELRFGSLAHAAGFIPTSHPSVHWNIGWKPLREGTPVEAAPGVWHPVKWLAPRRDPKTCEPQNAGDAPFGVAIAAKRPRAPFRRRPSLQSHLSTRSDIINWLIERQGYQSYLEIGVGDGAHLRAVRCAHKESVDPAEDEYARAKATHRMTSDAFFAQCRDQFDLIFIDGLHHSDVVYRDLVNSLAVLRPGGMIVCHDMNPSSEEMQIVPRQTRVWTGDCWKAWLQLRRERPDLCMAVANTDMGVGVIYPSGAMTAPPPDVAGAEIDWQSFVDRRENWLNLVPPAHLAQVLFREQYAAPNEDPGAPVTVVTLWRSGWSNSQQDVLDWLVGEEFPVGTQFVWTVVAGSETEEILSEAWEAMEAHGRNYTADLIEVPALNIRSELERHQVVAQLYDEALRSVEHDRVLFLEDDVVPETGAFAELSKSFSELPSDTALLGACYESRTRANHWCASDTRGNYLRVDVAGIDAGVREIGWVGGGLTLYRTDELLRSRPFHATAMHGWVKGWDVNLCERLRRRGLRLYLHTGVRAEHRFAESALDTAGNK